MQKIYFKIFILPIFLFAFFELNAQTHHYWVFFKDKKGSTFNPFEYFDAKAIERRIKSDINLYDSTDFPVNQVYIHKVSEFVESVNVQSRWFNAVSVAADKKQINKIKTLHFVKDIQPIISKAVLMRNPYDTLISHSEKDLLYLQTARMQADTFWNAGFTGKGIKIAVFDAGFPNVNKSPVFAHLYRNKQIIRTYDFARKKEEVYSHNEHGTMVLSCIAGKTNGRYMGLAPDAQFLLARTEVSTEPFSEEENWLAAMEWADKNGADIISSSLAYTYHRYYTFQMDGHTSLVAKAANMAAGKGMIVVNAMGNDGDLDWKILATPADADSVMSVGAINPYTDFHANFSSYGPNANYKRKPNVVAIGTVIAAGKNKLQKVKGTSFATPLVAGFIACAWQSRPFLTNMQLFDLIEQSGDLYPYYDYAHGYGVPQASFFTGTKTLPVEATFNFVVKNNELIVQVDKNLIVHKKGKMNNYLYYNIKDENGIIQSYWLIDVYQKDAVILDLSEIPENGSVTVHFKGFTNVFNPALNTNE
ncbi:MAG: S8 family serine peptidase [Bacteroidales bacterium]|nr:S8 family serine peptidase [Bacteroidales bacterium]